MKKLLFSFAVSLLLCNATSELFSIEQAQNFGMSVNAKVDADLEARLKASKAEGKLAGLTEDYTDKSWAQIHQKFVVFNGVIAGTAVVAAAWALKTWWNGRQ